MPLARIITKTPQDVFPLSRRLEAHGYCVEIVQPGETCESGADLEIELDKMPPQEALAQAARLSRGKLVNVLVGPGCVQAPQEELQAATLSQQLLEVADKASRAREVCPEVERPSRWAPLAHRVGEGFHKVWAFNGEVLRKLRVKMPALIRQIKQSSGRQWDSLRMQWASLRERQLKHWALRKEARQELMRRAEQERARHSLERQEELRHDTVRKRLLEEERERQRQLEEQLRRVRQAEEEESRQRAREARLERQRLEALRLAEERERVARERAEHQRLAEEARRLRAEEMERRRREREQEIIQVQQREALKLAEERRVETEKPESSAEPQPATLVPAEVMSISDQPSPTPVEKISAHDAGQLPSGPRWEGELNSPYHPAWTWASAAAGAVTVGIMLLWTAFGAGRSSVVQFGPVSPSTFLPSSARQIQQQVPFGPVKLVVHKQPQAAAQTLPTPEAVAPAAAPASAKPALQAVPAQRLPKPSAAKRQVASTMNTGSNADSSDGPDVVVRHFTTPGKAQVPQAGQTATIKHYSDVN